jgi:hypothetical protein
LCDDAVVVVVVLKSINGLRDSHAPFGKGTEGHFHVVVVVVVVVDDDDDDDDDEEEEEEEEDVVAAEEVDGCCVFK